MCRITSTPTQFGYILRLGKLYILSLLLALLRTKKVSFLDHHTVCMHVCPFGILKDLTDFHRTWHE